MSHTQGTIASWNFNSNALPQTAAVGAENTAINANNINNSGVSGNRYAVSGFRGNRVDLSKYIEFVIDVPADQRITITSISLDVVSDKNGPNNFQVRTNQDGFAATIISGGASQTDVTYSANALSYFIEGGESFVFRIYAWGAKGNGQNISFDDVIIQGDDFLPIELGAFTATPANEGIELNWTTLTEQDNDYMAVERSRDGQHFTEIGRVDGVGNSYQEQQYTFTDRSPATDNYYRLRQVDTDGTVTYHRIVYQAFQGIVAELKAWPNPVSNQLYLQAAGEQAKITLLDMNGQVLRQWTQQLSSDLPVDVQSLAAGSYLLNVKTENSQEHLRFIKR